MAYTVAGGPRDSPARPFKKVVLSSMLIERASGAAATPGGDMMTVALVSRCALHWCASSEGATSVKKLGRGVISVPGMTLPSLKGNLEERVVFTSLFKNDRGLRVFSGSRRLFRISLDSVESDASVMSWVGRRRRRSLILDFDGDMASESIDAVMSRWFGCGFTREFGDSAKGHP